MRIRADYKRQASRQMAWEEVAVEVDLPVNDVKKRWRSLRDAFIKHIRNSDNSAIGTMLHYDLMEFLTPYVSGENARRRTYIKNSYDNLDSMIYIQREVKVDENSLEMSMDDKCEGQEEYLLEEHMPLEDDPQTEFLDLSDQNYKVIVKRRLDDDDDDGGHCYMEQAVEDEDYKVVVQKRKKPNIAENEVYQGEPADTYTIEDEVAAASIATNSNPKTIAPELSADEKFLLSLSPAMKRLSQKKNSAFRIKIQQLLFELEYDEKYE